MAKLLGYSIGLAKGAGVGGRAVMSGVGALANTLSKGAKGVKRAGTKPKKLLKRVKPWKMLKPHPADSKGRRPL